jgi:hypothetical protein
LNYISITVDPIVIATLDVRFLQAWRSTGDYLKRNIRQKQSIRVPMTSPSNSLRRASGQNIEEK